MAAGIDGLAAGTPRPKLDRIDPWALRAAIAIIAFLAFGYSFGPAGGCFADAFVVRHDPAEVLARTDAWINPPAYTRKPPIYLSGTLNTARIEPISAPQGSQFVAAPSPASKPSRPPSSTTMARLQIGPPRRPSRASRLAAEFAYALDHSGTVMLTFARPDGRPLANRRGR